ncbi:hypothetical protein, partial [Candidatus Ichthyocystis hellenicum]|uniref:hypothetical protein n=1 Tax=Candidatus Ichthyocystis hellenicum TaxID=1561003 RepID=UPI003B968F09
MSVLSYNSASGLVRLLPFYFFLFLGIASAGDIYANGGQVCTVEQVLPKNRVPNAPVNSDIVIVYMSRKPNVCFDPTLIDNNGNTVPLRILLHDEYESEKKNIFYGDITLRPLQNLHAGERYNIFFNGSKISSFTTSRIRIDTRGHLVSILPLSIVVPHINRTSNFSRDELNTLFMRIAFDVREIDLPIDSGPWRAIVTMGNAIGRETLRNLPVLARENFSGSALSLVMSLYFPHIIYPNSLYGVSFYYAVYRTIDPHGAPVSLSAVVIIPNGENIDYSNIPVFSYQHATILNGVAQTEKSNLETIVGALIASRGYVVVSSDGLGFGLTKNRVEPYLMQVAEASEYTDLITAIRGYFENRHNISLKNVNYLMGISQGAHTSLAMARYMLSIDPSSVKDVYAADGPYNLEKTFFSYASMVNSTDSKSNPYLYYIRSHQFFLPVFMRRYLRSVAAYNNMPANTFESAFYDIIGLLKKSFVQDLFEGKYGSADA